MKKGRRPEAVEYDAMEQLGRPFRVGEQFSIADNGDMILYDQTGAVEIVKPTLTPRK